jgi:hypothetical protein
VHFALNCSIYKTTYYLLLEFCVLLIRKFSSKDAFAFNFYDDKENPSQDFADDIKFQLLEKSLDCHHLALTAFYPANEDTGRNMLEREAVEIEALGMAPAVKQMLLTLKLHNGKIIDRDHLKKIFCGEYHEMGQNQMDLREELKKVYSLDTSVKEAVTRTRIEYIWKLYNM